ncbi:unnamed protein product [Musa acuminata subsp. malaccensis]|uniref:(wild Malaysian banana) hypothetical protein n=1 Tax=Musa acuminata subsp. malaccensis TaxID=214687 RepID=A0A804JQ94_MUSAM|nr:PREDICTED: cucumber peeling cupredoxin-like [Musa acuminata subsp. malaccensis]CAG1848682.1 unnamed protein product [Musa acuminata subsp. malaccensis]
MAEAHRTLLLLVVAMSCLVTVSQAHQKIHIVGGSYGWKIPPNKTFYEEWANKQSFFVGDKLSSLISKKTKGKEMNDQSLFPFVFSLRSAGLHGLALGVAVFLYTTGLQNVIEASEEEEFAYCKQTNVEDVQFVGPTIVELMKVGVHYFYCSIGLHCEGGQKLHVNVTDEATA